MKVDRSYIFIQKWMRTLDKNFLFLAEVLATYSESKYVVSGENKIVSRDAHTVDIKPLVVTREMYINVPVMRPNSGGVSGTGISQLPEIGDLVVCTWLERSNEYPLCLGSITNTHKQGVTEEGRKRYDYTVQHKTGSFIRLRDPDGNGTASEIEVNHNSGAVIKIDTDGSISIKSGSDITINSGSSVKVESSDVQLGEAATDSLVLGDKFKTFMNEFLSDYVGHIHPSPLGPSGSPIPPFTKVMGPEHLSAITKTE